MFLYFCYCANRTKNIIMCSSVDRRLQVVTLSWTKQLHVPATSHRCESDAFGTIHRAPKPQVHSTSIGYTSLNEFSNNLWTCVTIAGCNIKQRDVNYCVRIPKLSCALSNCFTVVNTQKTGLGPDRIFGPWAVYSNLVQYKWPDRFTTVFQDQAKAL